MLLQDFAFYFEAMLRVFTAPRPGKRGRGHHYRFRYKGGGVRANSWGLSKQSGRFSNIWQLRLQWGKGKRQAYSLQEKGSGRIGIYIYFYVFDGGSKNPEILYLIFCLLAGMFGPTTYTCKKGNQKYILQYFKTNESE